MTQEQIKEALREITPVVELFSSDGFARAALTGLLASNGLVAGVDGIVAKAYQIADAMMAERQRRWDAAQTKGAQQP